MNIILILLGWLFVIGLTTIGIFEIVGTWKRWPFYVSPSEEWGSSILVPLLKNSSDKNGLFFITIWLGLYVLLVASSVL
jgi:hypothetical protein